MIKGKVVPLHAMQAFWREWHYNSTHYFVFAMDGGIGQFCASVALPCGKMFPVSVYYEARWVPEWCRREKSQTYS
jgi:hypothetical protein